MANWEAGLAWGAGTQQGQVSVSMRGSPARELRGLRRVPGREDGPEQGKREGISAKGQADRVSKPK